MYFVVHRAPNTHQVSFDDLMRDALPPSFEYPTCTSDTYTWCREYPTAKLSNRAYRNFYEVRNVLSEFVNKYSRIIYSDPQTKVLNQDLSSLYTHFKIPKASGGLRQIDAPNDDLKQAQNDLKFILENTLDFTHHTAAFAYVKQRAALNAVQRHKMARSRWVLKTDVSGFFPNTTPKFVFDMIYQVFPMAVYAKDPQIKELFEAAMSICFLRQGLPQGSPVSPLITNQMMIPIDYEIAKMCNAAKEPLTYTRYADDMDISARRSFGWSETVEDIKNIFKKFAAPFDLKDEKTHYGSTSGRNWMLGVMLNKDNNITIGHAKKKNFKNMLCAFVCSIKDGKAWSLEDAQHLQGLISYYRNVERSAIDGIIDTYSQKFHVNIRQELKDIIRGK